MIEFLVGMAAGIVLFWLVLQWAAKRMIDRIVAQIEQEESRAASESKSKSLHGVVEKHNNVLYLFERDTNEFIAQGHNMEELKQRVNERYRGSVTVLLNKQDLPDLT